jgi:Uma2 family endonuclease
MLNGKTYPYPARSAMSLPQPEIPFGPDDYLAWEFEQPFRNEYVDGEVFAMSGASDAHATAAGNLFVGVHAHLRRGPCRPYMNDLKVHVEAANSFFYPDILVTCDPRDRTSEANYVKHHPKLIVEVLSPSTEAYDRGNKFAAYRMLESLQEYVLVSTDQRRIEVFRRDATGHWVLYPFAATEELELTSIEFRCPVADVFEGVELESPAAPVQPGT